MESSGKLPLVDRLNAWVNAVLALFNIKRSLVSESILYALASAGALAIDFCSYSALIRIFHVNYQVAAVIGFSLGLCFIYYMSIKLVFSHRAQQNRVKEAVIFAVTGLLGLLLTIFILYIAVNLLQFNYEIAKLCSVSIVFVFNFTSRKILLFSERRK